MNITWIISQVYDHLISAAKTTVAYLQTRKITHVPRGPFL
jgi:hypothetical protein